MRITIINGFFLPMPPRSGGATEKSWFRLGREFAARGHEVTSFSRTWRTLPPAERIDGVNHRRLPGYDHRRHLWQNLLCDLLWGWRVYRRLPPADIVVCHAVTLPLWLGYGRPAAGRIVLMPGRMPKGQYRRYRRVARILAPSGIVLEKVVAENPALAPVARVTGYPIDWTGLNQPQPAPLFLPPRSDPREITLGYVGRIHEEKGLLLLADALRLVGTRRDLPPWRLILCGPSEVSQGGSGGTFRGRLLQRLSAAMGTNRFHVFDPQFNDRTLAGLYQQLDVFCYPSLAESGETFGVAVAEAMAVGAVPVVSELACFRDFVRPGRSGLTFDHRAPDAAARLAREIDRLLREESLRRELSAAARAEVRRFDYPDFADRLLADFATLSGG